MLAAPPFHMMYSGQFDPEQPPARRVDWRRIIAYFAPYWREEAVVLGCIGAVAVLGLVPPYLTKVIIDRAIVGHDLHVLWVSVGLMAASALMGLLIGVWQGYLNAYVGEAIMRDMRDALVRHLHRMPLSFFTSTKTGEIMNRVSSDVDAVDSVVTGTLVGIVTNAATILTTIVAIFILDWRLALLSVAVVPLMVLPMRPMGRAMYDVRKRTRAQRDKIESLLQETLSLSGIQLVKSFGRERQEAQRFHETGTTLMHLEIQLAQVGRWFMGIITALIVIGPALVWLGGGWLAVNGAVQVGTVVAFITYLGRLYGPAAALTGIQVSVVSALAVFERIFEYLDMAPEAPAVRTNAPITARVARGEVEFQGVRFGYRPERLVLDGIDLVARAGELVALVGPSGAGKTTILNLVPRFYDPHAGRVLVDGHDVRERDLDALREGVGIVMQETYLFHASVADNLRYGKPDASDEELARACAAANLLDVITSLPEGFATMVGERGHKLSGGERQRLALARVLLKDPAIMMLDEATSSLDSTSERLIQAALVPLMRGRTSLVIAHRLSTVLQADRIYVVDGGRIVEVGKHGELLARGGLYATLYAAQFREPEIAAV